MNPDLMKMAMENMSRFTPDQLADMQRQMANLPPGFIQQQMAAMSSMSPDVLRQQMAEAGRVDPSQAQAQLKQATATARQQEEYQTRCANQLKEEGNRLFSAQQTQEALEKYQRAKDNVKGYASDAARDLRTKCTLNLASCYLRLGDHAAVVRECSEVLGEHAGDRKALYRRGQAHLALRQHRHAVADLERALASSTDQDRDVIQEKLEKAREGFAEDEAKDPQDATAGTDGAEAAEHDGAVSDAAHEAEDIEMVPPQLSSAARPEPSFPAGFPGGASGFPSASGFPGGGMPGVDPAQARQMLGMLRDNPGMMQQMRSMMDSMGPEQLQAMARMSGASMPLGMDLSPDMLRSMTDTVAAMDPQDMERMLGAMGTGSPAPPCVPAAAPGTALPGTAGASSLAGAQVGPSGGMPGMPQNMAAVQQMLNNPEAVKMMHNMMSNMDAEQLAAISKASGHELTPDQAEMMAAKMKGMSEQQVQQLLKAASWLQRGVDAARRARDLVLANKLFVLGVIVLLLALLLRRLGYV